MDNGWKRIGMRKVWTNGKATILRPCDKKTFRIVDINDNSIWLHNKRFNSLEAAIKFAEGLN